MSAPWLPVLAWDLRSKSIDYPRPRIAVQHLPPTLSKANIKKHGPMGLCASSGHVWSGGPIQSAQFRGDRKKFLGISTHAWRFIGACVQHRTWTQSHANDPRHRDPTMALRNHYFHKQHQNIMYFDVWPEIVIRSVTNHGGERHIQWPLSWCLSVAPKPRAGFRQFWSWAVATALYANILLTWSRIKSYAGSVKHVIWCDMCIRVCFTQHSSNIFEPLCLAWSSPHFRRHCNHLNVLPKYLPPLPTPMLFSHFRACLFRGASSKCAAPCREHRKTRPGSWSNTCTKNAGHATGALVEQCGHPVWTNHITHHILFI